MIQRLCRVVVCSAFAIVGATAEQSREDWLKELSAAYAKQESFIVTYTSQGEGKSLEVTIGMDQRADLTLLHMIGKKDGQVHEVKQWNTPDDHFYLHAPAGLVRVDGVTNETRQLSKVLSAFNDLVTGKANPPLTWHPHISMLLNTKTVAMDMGFNKNSETMWSSALAGATVHESDKETVTFSTVKHGRLTFNRASGLLTRQWIEGAQGEERVLIAENVWLNPGKEAVVRMSSGWDTKARTQSSAMMTASLRSSFFQSVVDGVDEGKLPLEKLDTFLTEQRGALEQFADACVYTGPGSLSSTPVWEQMVDALRDDLRAIWVKKNPGKTDDEKAFATFLTDPKLREESRDQFLKKMDLMDGMKDPSLKEFLPNGKRPQGKTDDGKVAAEKIETALTRAYVSAILDRKMTELWGEAKP